MAIVKSKLLKQLSDNYPNFLKKDLEKFMNIFLKEIKDALKEEIGLNLEVLVFGQRTCKKPESLEIQKQGKSSYARKKNNTF